MPVRSEVHDEGKNEYEGWPGQRVRWTRWNADRRCFWRHQSVILVICHNGSGGCNESEDSDQGRCSFQAGQDTQIASRIKVKTKVRAGSALDFVMHTGDSVDNDQTSSSP